MTTTLDLLLRRRFMLNMSNKHIDPDIPGEPEITTDPTTGEVIEYENTTETTVSTAGTSIDTNFVPFNGKDWTMHIYAHFQYSEQTSEYPTLLCCMKNASPWPGITIRYESSTTLYIICNDDSGNKHYYTSSADSSGNIDITMTYSNNAITVVCNSSTLATSQSLSIDLSDLSLTLLADVDSTSGEARRYGIGTIYQFSIKKT